jgi:hypothetical protein
MIFSHAEKQTSRYWDFFLKCYPRSVWPLTLNWDDIQANFNLTFEMLQSNNVTWAIIKGNPNIPWDWECISANQNITWEIIRDNPDSPWNWYGVSRNPNITWDIVVENPDRAWVYPRLFDHIAVPCEVLRSNPDHHTSFSENPHVTWDIVQGNPTFPWDWNELFFNPHITLEIIEGNLDKPWNWPIIFMNADHSFGYDTILQHPEIWSLWRRLIKQPERALDLVDANPGVLIPWYALSRNPHVTIEYVKENLDEPWDWFNLTARMTPEIIDSNPTIPWRLRDFTTNWLSYADSMLTNTQRIWNEEYDEVFNEL